MIPRPTSSHSGAVSALTPGFAESRPKWSDKGPLGFKSRSNEQEGQQVDRSARAGDGRTPEGDIPERDLEGLDAELEIFADRHGDAADPGIGGRAERGDMDETHVEGDQQHDRRGGSSLDPEFGV